MDKKIPERFFRNDSALKNEIIERVVDQAEKTALKDGALFASLEKKDAYTLLQEFGTENKNVLNKKKDHGFRKDVYLLGADKDGVLYWLEAPSWDCDWYWGFGYVEAYTRNDSPSNSRDINEHTHIDSGFLGSQEVYDHDKKAFIKTEYVHNLYDSKRLVYTTFDEAEGWKLSELFKSYYLLKDAAAFFGRGGSHTTTNPVSDKLKPKGWSEKINKEMIPAITGEIIKILSPKV